MQVLSVEERQFNLKSMKSEKSACVDNLYCVCRLLIVKNYTK